MSLRLVLSLRDRLIGAVFGKTPGSGRLREGEDVGVFDVEMGVDVGCGVWIWRRCG